MIIVTSKKDYFSPLNRNLVLHRAGHSYGAWFNTTEDLITVECEEFDNHPKMLVIFKNDVDYDFHYLGLSFMTHGLDEAKSIMEKGFCMTLKNGHYDYYIMHRGDLYGWFEEGGHYLVTDYIDPINSEWRIVVCYTNAGSAGKPWKISLTRLMEHAKLNPSIYLRDLRNDISKRLAKQIDIEIFEEIDRLLRKTGVPISDDLQPTP
jgi:hypothetical protein